MTPGRLRILQIVSSSLDSGAERHALLLSLGLRERGHTVAVVCPPNGWLPRRCEAEGIEVCPSDLRGLRGLAELYRTVSRGRYDVLHAHLTRAAYAGALVGFLKRLPVVATVHIFSHDPVYRLVARRGRLIAVSESARAALLTAGIRPDAVDLVYNGTDFLDGQPGSGEDVRRELGLDGRRLVGLVGRVSREKGHLVALSAAERLAKTHPDVHFLFVGRVEPRFAEEFAEALGRNGVAQLVTAVGPREDVPRMMDAMDVVLLPSEKETFGMVAIEAMARGKPVIATRVGGLTEIVQDGETGILIDQDEAALADAIRALLDHPERARRMGEAGRELVRERFGHDRMAGDVVAVYAGMVAPAARRIGAMLP